MREEICFVTADTRLPFTVEMAGISYCDATYRIARQRASIAVVEYVIKGCGSVQEDQLQFTPPVPPSGSVCSRGLNAC